MSRPINIIGQRFGKLLVIRNDDNSNIKVWVKCDCGKEKKVSKQELKRGASKSCGCAHIRNIVGQRFHKLIVLDRPYATHRYVWVRCDCGVEKLVRKRYLMKNYIKSCGCLHTGTYKNILGQRFGRLTAIKEISNGEFGKWLFHCDCGKDFLIFKHSVVQGKTKSCGCYNMELRRGKTYEEIYGNEKASKLKNNISHRIRSPESNIKRSISCKKAGCGFFKKGRKLSADNIRKLRQRMVDRLKATHTNFHPGYNRKACEVFDKLIKFTGTHIQHALNGGEFYIEKLAYWVDGYDKENNIVYEYDERKRHYDVYGNLNDKDKIRQNEITEFLDCKFIRIKWNQVDDISLMRLSITIKDMIGNSAIIPINKVG